MSVPLLTPGEVAKLFRVDPKTVARWAKAERMHSVRTMGSHRRFLRAEMHYLLDPSEANRQRLKADAEEIGLRLDWGRVALAVKLAGH